MNKRDLTKHFAIGFGKIGDGTTAVALLSTPCEQLVPDAAAAALAAARAAERGRIHEDARGRLHCVQLAALAGASGCKAAPTLVQVLKK